MPQHLIDTVFSLLAVVQESSAYICYTLLCVALSRLNTDIISICSRSSSSSSSSISGGGECASSNCDATGCEALSERLVLNSLACGRRDETRLKIEFPPVTYRQEDRKTDVQTLDSFLGVCITESSQASSSHKSNFSFLTNSSLRHRRRNR